MKLSTAQQALLHAAWSAAASALMALVIGIFQYAGTNSIDLPGLAKYAGAGFVTAFLLVVNTVKSNPNLSQAEVDLVKQDVPAWANALHSKIDSILPFLHNHAAMPPGALPTPMLPGTSAQNFTTSINPQMAAPRPQFAPPLYTGQVPVVQAQQPQ